MAGRIGVVPFVLLAPIVVAVVVAVGIRDDVYARRFRTDAVNLEQLDAILQLVAIAEHGDPAWWGLYAACDDADPRRPIRASIIGLSSRDGGLLGAIATVRAFDPGHPLAGFHEALASAGGTNSHEGLEDLCGALRGSDSALWRRAVWRTVRRAYWDPAVRWAGGKGLTTALALGFAFDTAVAHGLVGLERVDTLLAGLSVETLGESALLRECMNARVFVVAGDKRSGPRDRDRARLWVALLEAENWDLQRPLADLWVGGASFTIEEDEEDDDGTSNKEEEDDDDQGEGPNARVHAPRDPAPGVDALAPSDRGDGDGDGGEVVVNQTQTLPTEQYKGAYIIKSRPRPSSPPPPPLPQASAARRRRRPPVLVTLALMVVVVAAVERDVIGWLR